LSQTTNDSAQSMTALVDSWLDNPLSRRILQFCTTRDNCGRRVELALRKYAGEDVKLCIQCSMAYHTISVILNSISTKSNLDSATIRQELRDPMWRKGLASVLEGIGTYGISKPFTGFSPFLIVWNVTRACNLNCVHCYESARTRAPDELDTAGAKLAVKKLADAGVAYVAFSGGEPLMRRDIFEMMQEVRRNEMAFSLATNGTLVTADVAERLKQLNCAFVQVSLDGATSQTHDSFRGAKSFERTTQGIRNLVVVGIQVGVAATATKHNLWEIPSIVDKAEQLGAMLFMSYNFMPTSRGAAMKRKDLSPTEREELLNWLAGQIGKRKLSLLSTAPQYSRICACAGQLSLTHFDTFGQNRAFAESAMFLGEFVGGCGAGRLYCALEPNGDIEPCVFIPLRVGNILRDNFLEIWHNHPVFRKIRDRENFKGYCGSCEYRNMCGGCRTRAYAYFGDLAESDPGCILIQKPWQSEQQRMPPVHVKPMQVPA
jgi:radical SAM protein with 4Fe4S-binding SPASM domain